MHAIDRLRSHQASSTSGSMVARLASGSLPAPCRPRIAPHNPSVPASEAAYAREPRCSRIGSTSSSVGGSTGGTGSAPVTSSSAIEEALSGSVNVSLSSMGSLDQEMLKDVVGCAPCMDGTTPVQIDEKNVVTKFIAETLLPTKHGKFRLRGYKHSIDGGKTFTEPTAIISGQVEGQTDVPVRVHDACYTSEVLGSLKCDCAEQLALAMETIYASPPGMVIYLQQEGRGIGLANKIAAYSLQEQGLDTVDANRALGLPDDCREYTSVRNIIRDLKIKSVKLMTNNPRKINQLKAMGIKITGRVPCVVPAGEFNAGYLDTKRDRMDHLLEGQPAPFCYWNHDGEPLAAGQTADEVNGGMGLPNGLTATPAGQVIPHSVQ